MLTRTWDDLCPRTLFVLLNPSTATEVVNDPTVERCERRARRTGFGAIRICNIFAWRSTDPKELAKQIDPVGSANDKVISDSCLWAVRSLGDRVICAWGNHGTLLDRGREVERLLRLQSVPLYHLGLTGRQHPRHPLYVGYSRQLQLWPEDH